MGGEIEPASHVSERQSSQMPAGSSASRGGPGGRTNVTATLPTLLQALEPAQDAIAARCRKLPGPFIEHLASHFDAFEPTFSLAPFIQGLLTGSATLSKKRLLIFLRGTAEKPFPRYCAHWMTCIAERNNAKSFIEDCTGVPMITDVMDWFKSNRSKTMRQIGSHFSGLEDGSSKNVTNDSSSALVYKLAAANERLNTWTLISDEADTVLLRLEDQTSSSETRYLNTAWDAGRRLTKGDSATDCITMHWQLIMFLIMQPALKIREIVFEQEVKPLGVALRGCASTYRKPRQEWESEGEFDAAESYRAFTRKKSKSISPLKEAIWTLLAAVVVVNSIFPQSALDAHPPGVRTSNTPASARHARGGPTAHRAEEDGAEQDSDDGAEQDSDMPPPPPPRGAAGSISLLPADLDESPPDAVAYAARLKEALPPAADVLGDDDIEPTYVASDLQQRLDRQSRQWELESSRIYPSDDNAHKQMGTLLAHYDELTTGATGKSAAGMTTREVYRRGLAGKSKENLMSIANAWEFLDSAAILVEEACARFGREELYAAERMARVAALIKTRKEQQGLDDSFFFDTSCNQLAYVLFVGPVKCAAEMIDMSMLTNMTAFDAVYPEEALADARAKMLAANANKSPCSRDQAMPPPAPPLATPLREPLSNQLKADAVKALQAPGFSAFKREFASSDRAHAAFEHLTEHGLALYIEEMPWFTVDTNKLLWSDKFVAEIKGSVGHILLKLPHDHLSQEEIATRLVNAQLPIGTMVKDPREPVPGPPLGQYTRSKQAHYLRWLITLLHANKKLAKLNEGSSESVPALLSIAGLCYGFMDETKVIKNVDVTTLAALKEFNAPLKDSENAGDNFKPLAGSTIDLLHRTLFNLAVSHTLRTPLDTETSPASGPSSSGSAIPYTPVNPAARTAAPPLAASHLTLPL